MLTTEGGKEGQGEMSSDYKYDVAFSFLQDDEQLVLEIADRVRGRVNPYTFVYSVQVVNEELPGEG